MSKTIKANSETTLSWSREELLTYKSTSARVRYLIAHKESRSEIAKILNIRYQHVRNIEITPIKKI